MTVAPPNAYDVWSGFCRRFGVVERSVPLFEADEHGTAATRLIGRGDNRRAVLVRSPQMESLVIEEAAKVVSDWHSGARSDL